MAPYCYTIVQWEHFDYSVQNLKEAKKLTFYIFAFI